MADILVVDDDPISRKLLEARLRADHTITLASNGREALDLLQTGYRPCVILLDLTMPEMDGFDFYQAKCQDPDLAPIPIVVISAVLDIPEVTRFVPAVAQLAKPVNFTLLLEILEELCHPDS